MLSIDPMEVRRRAQAELRSEEFQKAVELEKDRLRHGRTRWDWLRKVFPFTITITRSK